VRKKRPSFKKQGLWIIILLLASFLIFTLFISVFQIRQPEETVSDSVSRNRFPITSDRERGRPETDAASELRAQRIAVIVDDIGYDLTQVNELIHIPELLTFAILPHCTYSIEAAERLHRAGKEILLHLPMEPQDYPEKNPGEGALFVGMDDDTIKDVFFKNLRAVPYAVGVNNHMGSKFMEDSHKLGVVFQLLKQEKLFFVDSLTTGKSQGRTLAADLDLPFLARDVFIDRSGNFEETYKEFEEIIRSNKDRHKLIVIGHPYPSTISAIRMATDRLRSEGIEIVKVSDLFEN